MAIRARAASWRRSSPARQLAPIALVGAAGLVVAAIALTSWLCACREMAAVTHPWPRGAVEEPSPVEGDEFPPVDWDYWRRVNPDVVGWVSVPGTEVSHPIVLAPANDESFYLTHDLWRRPNPYGCPYLDASCAAEGLDSRNAVVLGHSLLDGSMFSPLTNYADERWARAHASVLLQTPQRKRRLRVRAIDVMPGSTAHKQTNFTTTKEHAAWWNHCLDEADITLRPQGIDTLPESVVSLVTCSYVVNPENERIVVLCTDDPAGASGQL